MHVKTDGLAGWRTLDWRHVYFDGVYVDITAFSDPVTLMSASSPASSNVELHETRMDGDMMQIRHADELFIEAGETYTMRPGGDFHLMLLCGGKIN
ncbi:MAG: copper chaperone PCu(A)C [Halomonas sp.]|uniref:copper chaperone PCu(A)C n=1 Tax=unclassified Halomonas TaxID=2609666 RepID=UPI00264BBB2B|nr:copper chaperone PCu(A)C [Halomonas sp.]